MFMFQHFPGAPTAKRHLFRVVIKGFEYILFGFCICGSAL